jgi:hypothetical protein
MFLVAMLLHLVFMIWYNSWQSAACDESGYFSYALRWAKGHPERIGILDDSKTPMVFPALWSLSLKAIFPSMESNNGEGILAIGRIAMYAYFYLLSLGFFCWSYRLLGPKKWVLPWVLFIADPLIISNGMLIGSDLASACCMFWAFYLAWQFSNTQSMRYWWLLSIVCGLAMIIKISMIIVIPMMAILLLVKSSGNKQKSFNISPGKWVANWISLFAICLLLINTGYQFSKTGKPLNSYEARSQKIKMFQTNYPLLSSIPIPVPFHYISSYDLLLRNAAVGGGYTEENSYHGAYLNGEYKNIGGFKNYYVFMFFYKTTPMLLLALVGATLLAMANKNIVRLKLQKWAFVWLPTLGFLLWISLANPFQIGIRHALPVWPFLYLLTGPFLVWVASRFSTLLVIAICLQFAEITWQLPNLTAYTPIWMQPKKNLLHRLNDSNLSYCNDAIIYKHFLDQHPEYKVPTEQPHPGKFALRLTDCNSYAPANGPISCWLLQHFTPVGHYKTTILLFEISEQQIIELTAKVSQQSFKT